MHCDLFDNLMNLAAVCISCRLACASTLNMVDVSDNKYAYLPHLTILVCATTQNLCTSFNTYIV